MSAQAGSIASSSEAAQHGEFINTDVIGFPFDQLPQAGEFKLPRYQAAVLEVIEEHQVPERMAYYIGMTACCAAAQTRADAYKPRGGLVGLGVYTLLSAISGERKTTVDGEFFRSFVGCNEEIKAWSSIEAKRNTVHQKVWNLKMRKLTSKYEEAKELGKDTTQLLQEMKDHAELEPDECSEWSIVMKDFTVPALKLGLKNVPCIAILSSDCWKLFAQTILPNDDDFCQIWSNESINVSRVKGGYTVLNPRVTKCISIQPDKLKLIMAEKGAESIASGYLGRVIYVKCGSTIGTRLSRYAPTDRAGRDLFNKGIKEVLDAYLTALKAGNYSRTILKFSSDASHLWIEYLDYVEKQMREGGRYSKAIDHGSKLADNVARIAAAFHFAEGFEGDIGVDCVLTAIALCNEASKDYMEDIVPKDQEDLDAMELYEWLKNRDFITGSTKGRAGRFIDVENISQIAQFGPYRLRKASVIKNLLGVLVRKGLIQIGRRSQPGRRDTFYVDMTPGPF